MIDLRLLGAGLAGCLLGCPAELPDPGAPAAPLPPPDLSGVDLDAAVLEAVGRLTRSTTRALWAGHAASLSAANSGCPIFWSGGPPELDVEEGFGWQDACTAGSTTFDGAASWSAEVTAEGQGARAFEGIATVSDGAGSVFAAEGRGEDRLSVEGAGYRYESSVNGAFSGSAVADPVLGGIVGGWRGVAELGWSGGGPWALDVDANVTWPESPLESGFDAVDAAFSLAGPGTESGCALEPVGRMSLRLAPGTWVELAFAQPDPAVEDAVLDCDGCAPATVRGLPVGEVCPDFSGLWTEQSLPRAPLTDFVLTIRTLESEDRP